MSEIAVRVENLGKQYRIGQRVRYQSLRESIMHGLAVPYRRLRSAFQPSRGQRSNRAGTMWALRDVSFEVKPGEVVGIIGRNGAGKSTLLKILSRVTEPTTGAVDLFGRIGSLLEVGTGFHPELTGRENIFLSGAILGMTRREISRNFDDIVAFSGVEKFLETPVKHYSSGMYMRLAFAVAAYLEQEILVVDEVLAVGDAEFQRNCLAKMDDLAHKGRTVLFVSHNMNAIQQLCQRVMLLDSGRLLLFDADPKAVIQKYLSCAGQRYDSQEWVNHRDSFRNPWFRPTRFVIADASGAKLPMPVSNSDEVWVRLEAEIEQLDPALTIGYALYTADNQLLYWSYQTDTSPEMWPRLSPGTCVLSTRLPTRFLNAGTYRLELAGGLHYRDWLFRPGTDVPSITLTIEGGLSDSPLWMVKRPGLLAPVIPWRRIP